MKRVIIVGSPRSNGRSAHVAEMLFEAHIDERPEDELFLVPVSEVEVGPCIGCNACREQTEVVFVDDDGAERVELRPRCVFDDDMQALYDLIDEADELTVVSPVYFSGAPAMMKCVLDRMQPYFWADARKAPKRPATLHVLGEGGDPHGFDPLVSEVKSSLACAGFRLERVYDWVGKVSGEGEITAEASVVEIASGGKEAPAKRDRPRLDLSSGQGASQRPGQEEARQPGQDRRQKPSQSAKRQPVQGKQGKGGQKNGKPRQAGRGKGKRRG